MQPQQKLQLEGTSHPTRQEDLSNKKQMTGFYLSCLGKFININQTCHVYSNTLATHLMVGVTKTNLTHRNWDVLDFDRDINGGFQDPSRS